MTLPAGAYVREGVAYTAEGAMCVSPTGTAAITGGTITGVSGVQYDIAKWDIPVIQAPTGTMGNNGAVTLGTALPTIYAKCYLIVPAGAVAAGVPAAEESYYCQMSSTTVGVLFNNTQAANTSAAGEPLIPASPTAFVTTGPGAFTGVTTTRTVITVPVAAGAMGTTGQCDVFGDHSCVSAATNKVVTLMFGGTTVVNVTQTTVSAISYWSRIKNRGSASAQREGHLFATTSATTIQGNAYPAVNTANAVNIVYQLQKATATEYLILEGGRVAVTPA